MAVLVSGQNLAKAFGPRPLFQGLSIDLRDGEKLGLIGSNGAGKSTLLKLLAGLDSPDEGVRALRRGLKLGYLSQEDSFPPGQTVLDVLLAALKSEPLESYEAETRAAITLTQVGFEDDQQIAEKLSGGWRKRLALARELVREPDFLLLDEPTNHLDLPGVRWLERLLRAAPYGYMVATHDRAFLRAVADEIVEISRIYPTGYFRASGSYDDFADRRGEFLEGQAKQQQSLANQVRRETEWLGRKAQARTRKASSRIEEAGQRREELGELKYRNAQAGAAGLDMVSTGRQSRKLLAATGLQKSLGGRLLFDGIDIDLGPGIKLGLLGPNGSGKSTLLKLLSGELAADAGTVVRAEGLRTAIFEQGRTTLDTSLSLRKALCPQGDTVIFRDRPMHVLAWAKQFLFTAEQLDATVSSLSGGEQARVRIAQLMLQPADLLFLDEPTNDLDIPALEALEETLGEFPGAIVLVSHDRDLMDRLCTAVIGLDGEGNAGSYATVGQWLDAYEKGQSKTPERPVGQAKGVANSPTKTKKLSYKEQQELDTIEAKILAAEEEMAKREEAVNQASTSGHSILKEACQKFDASRAVVEKLYARWQELEAKRS